MNKTKRVAWHKHLKKARNRRAREEIHAAHPAATSRPTSRGATSAARHPAAPARPAATTTRPTTPRP